MIQKKEVDSEKYKLLYEYQKNQFDIAKNHYSKLEDKASKYLTFLGIVITAYTLMSKFYIFDYQIDAPKSFSYYFIFLYIGTTFCLLCDCSATLFKCLKVEDVSRPSGSQMMIDYIENNERNSVYKGLAQHYKETIESYLEKNEIKANLLKKSYEKIRLCSTSLVFMIILIFIIKFIWG